MRFFDYVKGITLGSCLIEENEAIKGNYGISAVCVINEKVVIVGNVFGDIFLLEIQEGDKFGIEIVRMGNNGSSIEGIEVCQMDKINYWLCWLKNGKIMVWNRKNLSRDPAKVKTLETISELEYYLVDNYKMELSYDWNEKCSVKFSNCEEQIYVGVNS